MSRNAVFEDVDEDAFGVFGVLGGTGSEATSRLKTVTKPEGIRTSGLYCEHCGTTNALTVEWLEAIYGSLGFVPRDWRVDEIKGVKYLCPHVGCSNNGCRREIRLGFTPVELKGHVQRGVQNQDVNPEWVQQQVLRIQQQVAARR